MNKKGTTGLLIIGIIFVLIGILLIYNTSKGCSGLETTLLANCYRSSSFWIKMGVSFLLIVIGGVFIFKN